MGWVRLEGCSSKEAELRGKMTEGPNVVLGLLNQINALESFDEKKANELTKIFLKNDTWLTSTLSAREALTWYDKKLSGDDVRLKYISPAMREGWKRSYIFSQFAPEQLAKLKSAFPKNLKIINMMHHAGAKILAGTDTGVPYVFPGFSLHEELALFVKAGLTPLEALQTATINPAKFLGREKELGTIERGKLADLVLLDANPLADISNTKKINAVVVNGRLLDRPTSDKMLADAEAAANKK